MHDIRKWQRATKNLLAAIKKIKEEIQDLEKADEKDLQALQQSEKALQEKREALKSLKQQRLKEYNPQLGATVNRYSLVSTNKKTKEQKVVLQNIGENKRDRQRAEDNAKTHESLFILPKQSGFAYENG